eukprot:COSAG01_NODE_6785_length_3499_cov_2.432059_2_plen_39_part_00
MYVSVVGFIDGIVVANNGTNAGPEFGPTNSVPMFNKTQ